MSPATGETSERIVRKILELQADYPNADTFDIANMATAHLKEKVTEADVVRVRDDARAEKMRGRA